MLEGPQLFTGCYAVQSIRNKRINPKTEQIEYEIKWIGWDDKDNTWQPIDHLNFVKAMVDDFEKSLRRDRRREDKNNRKDESAKRSDQKTGKLQSQNNKARKRKISKKKRTGRRRKMVDKSIQAFIEQVDLSPTKQAESGLQNEDTKFKENHSLDPQSEIDRISQSDFNDLENQSLPNVQLLLMPFHAEQSTPHERIGVATRSKTQEIVQPPQIQSEEGIVESEESEEVEGKEEKGKFFNWDNFIKGKVEIIDTWLNSEGFYYKIRDIEGQGESIWVNKSIFQKICPQVLTQFLSKHLI